MPSVPVYIRKEDFNKWLAIENKSEFIHNALNNKTQVKYGSPPKPPSKVLGVVKGSDFADPIMGYPCCQQKRPCKHWVYNGADENWINQLTGETKNV